MMAGDPVRLPSLSNGAGPRPGKSHGAAGRVAVTTDSVRRPGGGAARTGKPACPVNGHERERMDSTKNHEHHRPVWDASWKFIFYV